MVDEPIVAVADAGAWNDWLLANPDADGVWLLVARKNSSVPAPTYAEAVEVALRHGWIDSRKRRHDDNVSQQRFTPRRRRSPWSQVNREAAERLIAAGLMHPAGLAQVEAAKADGRWDKAYPPQSTAEIPDDLAAAMDADPQARAAFAAFDRQNRYALIFRLSQLSPAGRKRRIDEFVAKVAAGWKPHA